MTRLTRNYNIHDIFKFSITSNNYHVLNYVDKTYSFFRVDAIKNADLELIEGSFFPSIDNNIIINGKYYMGNNSLYCADSYKLSKWKVWIEHLDKNTKVHFSGDRIFSHWFLLRDILEPLMRYKLTFKGFSFIHSSCVGDRDNAYLFSACKGVGKTSTAMSLIERGLKLFSDDYTILSKNGDVFSFPCAIRLHGYNLDACPFLKNKLSLSNRFRIGIKEFIYNLSFHYANITQDVNIREIFSEAEIGIKSPLKMLILFTKTNGDDISIKCANSAELIQRLIIINKFEMSNFLDYLQAYSYADPTNNATLYWDYEAKNFQILSKIPCYEIAIPKKYTPQVFKSVEDFIAQNISCFS
jgi:hypothetical protein